MAYFTLRTVSFRVSAHTFSPGTFFSRSCLCCCNLDLFHLASVHMPKTWIVHLLFCCDAGTTGVIAGTTGNQSATKFEFVLAET